MPASGPPRSRLRLAIALFALAMLLITAISGRSMTDWRPVHWDPWGESGQVPVYPLAIGTFYCRMGLEGGEHTTRSGTGDEEPRLPMLHR